MSEELMEHSHKIHIEKAVKGYPSGEKIEALAKFYQNFASKTRMQILFCLMEGELGVCCIAKMLDAEQSLISHQLKILKEGKLVESRREGKTIYYRLADDHIKTIISVGFEHLEENNEKIG